MKILRTDQLDLGYNGKMVVKGLHMSIHQGEMVGLIGPNGAGKTTVLRALAGLLKPRNGQVYYQKQSISSLRAQDRARNISLVPQREAFVWPLLVEDIVQLGRAPHRGWFLPFSSSDVSVVNRVLHLTGLSRLRKRSINKLSGGEFQRVMIARALAQEPEVLLLDEPTSNLDIHHQIHVFDLVRKLVDEKHMSVVVAIHDLALAARYCDRLVLLHKGKQCAVGTPEEVLTSENLQTVFGVRASLYRDPLGYWALSVKQTEPVND